MNAVVVVAAILAFCAGVSEARDYYYSNCETSRGEKLQYLDRHEVGLECYNGYNALNYFRLGEYSCSDPKMQYKYSCSSTVENKGKDIVEKYTSCNKMRDYYNQYLDRQDVQCPSGYAVSYFDVTSSGCSGNDMRYRFYCTKIPHGSITSRSGSCQDEHDRKVQYLDRISASCEEHEVMVGFELTSSGCSCTTSCSWWSCEKDCSYFKYIAKCATPDISSPPPPSPPPPSPSPPPPSPSLPPLTPSPPPPSPSPPPIPVWEDYVDTVCKQPSDEEGDNDDGTYRRIDMDEDATLDQCKQLCLDEEPLRCWGVEFYTNLKKGKSRCDIFTEKFTHIKTKKDRTCSVNKAIFDEDIGLETYVSPETESHENGPQQARSETTSKTAGFVGLFAVIGAVCIIGGVIISVYRRRTTRALEEGSRGVYQTVYDDM